MKKVGKVIEITYGWMFDFLSLLDNEKVPGFFKTGSSLFDSYNEESDIDYIVCRDNWEKVHAHAERFYGVGWDELDKYPTDNIMDYEFQNIKFQKGLNIYDFIIVPDRIEYKVWVYATKAFLKIIENDQIDKMVQDKESRIIIFEAYKEAFRKYFYRRKK